MPYPLRIRLVFAPYEPGKSTGSYDEIYVQPFTPEKIANYVKRYFELNEKRLRIEVAEKLLSEEWSQLETYQKAIEDIAGLKELIKTPLMCRLTLEALPELSKQLQQTKQTQKIERVQVYEAFMQRWVKQQIAQKQLKVMPEKVFELGQHLALEMFKDKVASIELGQFHFSFDEAQEKFVQKPHRWQAFFNENTLAERSSLPLQEMGENKFKFIHFSIQEFLLARHLYQQLIILPANTRTPVLKDRDWNTVILSVDVKDRPVLYFLGDFAKVDNQFEALLFQLIEQTKTDKSQARAGANAITVLNASHARLSGRDFAHTALPVADLSGAILVGSDFAGADLRGTNCQAVRFDQVNLDGANLSGIRLGEWPMIETKGEISSCVFSPNGQQLAVGVDKVIELYDVASRRLVRRLERHTDSVHCVSFNGAGDKLASASYDKTVRLWDVESGKELKVLEGWCEVMSVSFNGGGDKIA